MWEVTGEKDAVFRTKWESGHNLRKGKNPLRKKKELWVGIRMEPDGQEDRSKTGRGPF